MVRYLRNCWTVFQSGSTILYFDQKWMMVPVSLYFHQDSVSSVFWILTFLTGIWWYIIIILIWSFLIMWYWTFCLSLLDIYIYMHIYTNIYGLPLWLSWQRICIRWGKPGFSPWVGKIPCRRERLPIPGFWPGEFHRLYRAWGRKESDMTEWLSLWHINIYSCIYFGKVSLQSFTCIFCLFLSFESFSVFWIQFFYWLCIL